jgi:succinate-acetate transporter protein
MSSIVDLESQKANNRTIKPSEQGSCSANCPAPIQLANAKPVGLFSFAVTTLVLSLVNIHAGNVTTPNILVGLGIIFQPSFR